MVGFFFLFFFLIYSEKRHFEKSSQSDSIFDSNTVTLCSSQAAEKKSVDVHLDRSIATTLAPAGIITQLKGTVSSSDVGIKF